MGFFRGFFRPVLLQSQTLKAGQHRCKTGTMLRHSGARPTSAMPVGSEFFPPPVHRQLSIIAGFLILQFNHDKDNENNVNISSLDCELLNSRKQNTCLFGTLSFLPQNTPAISWPGHQASRGWLETHFEVSVLNGFFQLLTQPAKQAGWNYILLWDVKFPCHRRIELSSCAKLLCLSS